MIRQSQFNFVVSTIIIILGNFLYYLEVLAIEIEEDNKYENSSFIFCFNGYYLITMICVGQMVLLIYLGVQLTPQEIRYKRTKFFRGYLVSYLILLLLFLVAFLIRLTDELVFSNQNNNTDSELLCFIYFTGGKILIIFR